LVSGSSWLTQPPRLLSLAVRRLGRGGFAGCRSIGYPPPGELRDVYEIEAQVRLINRDNGGESKAPTALTKVAYFEDPDWEKALCKAIGKLVGMHNIPLAGYHTATGEEVNLTKHSRVGIDGVLP
jgi:hypothetical protein